MPRSALGRTEGSVVWLVVEERKEDWIAEKLQAADLFQAGRRDLNQRERGRPGHSILGHLCVD